MTIAAAGHARRSILVGLGAAALAPALLRAQTAASPFPTRADLAGDVAILRAALAMHPGLYRYNTPAQMAARLGGFAAAFTGGTSTEQRYLILARFLATIRCGHSYPNFFNQSKAVTAALFDRTTRLPFDFAWIGGDMVVLGAPAPLALPPGSRISTINGERASHLLARLMPYIRADGSNDGKRIALLEMRNTDTIETFDVFQGLIAPPLDGIHHVRGITPGGAAFALDLPAIGLAARRAAMEKISDDGDEVRWQWAMRGDGVAVLTMPGWALYNSKWNWQAWLDERLDSLAGAKGLVIDLRDNEGGNDCGDAILARLIDRPLAPPGYVQKLRFERTPPALDRYLDTWDDSFRTLGVGGKRLADGFISLPGGNAAQTITPASKRLTLPVATLIGPTNSSATFQFALMARASGKVRLFGRTTGGNQRGINGGAFFFVRLPASGLEFDLPLIGNFATRPVPDAGLAPDVMIAPTPADIAAGRDPALDAAMAWVTRA